MGKPLAQMTRGQEVVLGNPPESLDSKSRHSNQKATSKTSINGTMVEANDVKRSSTNASNNSAKTSKSNSSNESGLCSFVHSNASSSSSNSADHSGNAMNTTFANVASVVPKSITTSAAISRSSSSKVKIAIQNYEESIEITRQKSLATSIGSISRGATRSSVDETKPLAKSASPSRALELETNEAVTRAIGKSTESTQELAKASSLTGISRTSKRKSMSSSNNFIKSSHKSVDESTITSTPSCRSSSFGSSHLSTIKDDESITPRFEVLLDETPETDREVKPTKTSASSKIFGRSRRPSPEEVNGVISRIEVLLDESPDGKTKSSVTIAAASTPIEVQDKETVTIQSKVEPISTKETRDSSAVNPRLFVNRRNQRSTGNRRKHQRQRQLSIPTRSPATVKDPSVSSNLFFSAIDEHVETRTSYRSQRHGVPKLVQNDDSVEVIERSKSDDASDVDLNNVLSPSKTRGARRSPTPTTSYFQMPPSPMGMALPTQMKKVYSIVDGKLVVNTVDECEQKESIEVNNRGSPILEHLVHETKQQQQELESKSNTQSTIDSTRQKPTKMPYGLVRLEKSSHSKSSLKSSKTSGFLRKNKKSKSSPQNVFSQKPIKVINDVNNGAIELFRAATNVTPNTSFSYDETDEDTIIKNLSPISSTSHLESIGKNDKNIELVASSSHERQDDAMGQIVGIRKIGSRDEKLTSVETSAQPNKFEPVIETPSNRAEGSSAAIIVGARSHSTQSVSSMPISPISKISSGLGGKKATEENETNAPRNGDQLVVIGRKQSIPKTTKPIPKIPASKRDTTCKSGTATTTVEKKADDISSDSGSTDKQSSPESSKKVKIQVYGVQKANENIKNIEVESVASSVSEEEPENNVPTSVKKYSKMVVKKPLPVQESKVGKSSPNETKGLESKYVVVHANVLGVAGIVVNRKKCRDVTGDDRSPSPPEEMTAVVGISESGANSIDSVTTFSNTLVHVPNTKNEDDEKSRSSTQRHIAVWASNDMGETPGSVVKSKILDLNRMRNQKSRFTFLDLDVALVKSGEGKHHAAAVIGTASIKVTDGMINGKYRKTIDLPVHKVVKDGPSSPSNENRILFLRTSSDQRNDHRRLSVERTPDGDEYPNQEDLAPAYTIDPAGDSMIRIQIYVEEVSTIPKHKVIKNGECVENHTAATERSEESSISSRKSQEEPKSKELYSKQLELPNDFAENTQTRQTLHWETSDEMKSPGCRVFGKQVDFPACSSTCSSKSEKGLVGQIDDRIEGMADRVFSKTCRRSQKGDSSFAMHDTASLSTGPNDKDTTYPTLLDEIKSVLQPVPTLNKLRLFAKDLNFFADDREALAADDIFSDSSVGSATLAEFEEEQRRARDDQSLESWRKRRNDDDITYSSEETDEDSLSLNRAPSNEEDRHFAFDRRRRVVSENNKFDIDTDNRKKALVENRSFESYPQSTSNLDFGCDGDDEDSIGEQEDQAALLDEVIDEDKRDNILKRESSGKHSSLPSVVENIAEVLSIGGKACGYYSADKVDTAGSIRVAIWRMQSAVSEGQIPKTVDNDDLQSVGELTAMTLEKNEIKEKNRKLLMARLGLPKDILNWGSKSKTSTGKDSEEQSTGIDSEVVSAKPENYFVEYQEGKSGVRSIYESSDVSKEEALEKAERSKTDSPTDISSNESTEVDLNQIQKQVKAEVGFV